MACGVAADLIRIDPANIVANQHLGSKQIRSSVQTEPAKCSSTQGEGLECSLNTPEDRLATNDRVMRNPLSKQMFSESDIRKIMAHPLGQRLKPLQMAQSQLKRGVQPATIDRVSKLGSIMLSDQSSDAGPSRQAMDEFFAYAAALPESEQKTINLLKIPAKDRNTGQPFDYTIGESVRDAKANATCFHKVGSFRDNAVRLRDR